MLAASAAVLSSLPALRMPLISDDWGHLAAVAAGIPARTPMGYARPLTLASLRFDLLAWGLNPLLSHLFNIVLIAGSAFLVVVLVRRYTGDATLAGTTGLLFALHPYHVETAAWIAARTDTLFTLALLCAALSYDRWRERRRGLPVVALLAFAASLLAKETAVVFLGFIPLLGLLDRSRRASGRERLRGWLPLAAVAVSHFAVLRPMLLGEAGLDVLRGAGWPWIARLVEYGIATILPAQTELIEAAPRLWTALACLCITGLAIAAARPGRFPRVAIAAAAIFPVLLGPSLISFQERYFFLAGAASSLALAAILLALGWRPRLAAIVLLAAFWSLSLVDHWTDWLAASRASSRLVDDLVEASGRPGIDEIVVANMPHRIGGAPVAANLGAAVALLSGRQVLVEPAAYVDYPTELDDALAGPPIIGDEGSAIVATIRLQIPDRLYSRLVYPPPGRPGEEIVGQYATVRFGEAGEVRVRITGRGPARSAYVWSDGRLRPIF